MPFRIAKFEMSMAVTSPLRMPVYKASTLRGVLGSTLRRISCSTGMRTCDGCPLITQCAYGYLMATKANASGSRFDVNSEVARPYVIEPPLDSKEDYPPGDSLRFDLLLFGKAIQFLPYFLVTFRELPPLGLPGRRGKLELTEVWAVDDLNGRKERLYNHTDQVVRNTDLAMDCTSLFHSRDPESRSGAKIPTHRGEIRNISLRFLTNTILKYHGETVQVIEFHVLLSRLIQRLESLAVLHGDGEATAEALFSVMSPRELINAAKEIRLFEHAFQWKEWKRFSSTQDRDIPMSGLIGTGVYEGDISPFLPYLRLGEFTHIGKGCVMGLGKYVIEPRRR